MRNILIDGESLFDAANGIQEFSHNQYLETAFTKFICSNGIKKIDDETFLKFMRFRDFGGVPVTFNGTATSNAVLFDALFNVMTCIILWDKVYVFDEAFNSHFIQSLDYFSEFASEFCVLNREELISSIKKNYDINNQMTFRSEEMVNAINEQIDTLLFKSNTHIVRGIPQYIDRALKYYYSANEMNLDYMPSIRRQVALESYGMWDLYNRINVLNKLDAELVNYYSYVNENIGRKVITYRFPVLFDYILRRYRSMGDIVKACFELRNDNAVISFRNEMDELDREFDGGNIQFVDKYFSTIEKIVNDFSGRISSEHNVQVTLGLSPALTFNVDRPNRKPFHCSFLKNLTYFGIHARAPIHFQHSKDGRVFIPRRYVFDN